MYFEIHENTDKLYRKMCLHGVFLLSYTRGSREMKSIRDKCSCGTDKEVRTLDTQKWHLAHVLKGHIR